MPELTFARRNDEEVGELPETKELELRRRTDRSKEDSKE